MNVMSAINFDTIPNATSDGPRKRRKRAPAAGAANDCFTCQNRKIKCSRGRPYCAQCLDAGQDCAGYKTQLTWGVGVASRGKLRGLSLPVPGAKKTAELPSPPKPKKRTGPSAVQTQSSPTSSVSPETVRKESPTSIPVQSVPVTHTAGYDNGSVYQSLQHTGRGSISFAPASSNSHPPGCNQFSTSSPAGVGWTNVNVFQPQLYTPPPLSPLSYPVPAQNGHFLDQNAPVNYHHYHLTSSPYPVTPNPSVIVNHVFPSNDTYSSYPPQDQSYEHSRDYLAPSSHFHVSTLATDIPSVPEQDVKEIKSEVERECALSDTLSTMPAPLTFDMGLSVSPFSGASPVGKTPRMRYLIQYYAEVIAPVIVAFDSTANPFREQILTLAAKSESLQHAISALAASNLRQRRETGTLSTGKTLPARRSSAAHLSLTNEAWYDTPILPPREQKREEIFHKHHAVQSLNQALANPKLRKEDSVLATLLVLCLFHICDSGIARFQTQFAGVRMLLTLRQNELGAEDHKTKWMTRLFTLYDGLAATVNEREGQFESQQLLDQPEMLEDECSYETLSGIDTRLFKIMSKLGRLNILSQGKPVEENPTLISNPMPKMRADVNSFDGNGWMRIVEDENFFTFKTANPDVQEQFWREWRHVRQALQMWDMVTLSNDSAQRKGSHLTDDQRTDVGNISNAFRYSALLYTERLGNPRLLSSDEKIQYWVRHALYYIKQVRSDVYLLWPLFITGSECVHEEGRNIIRERCLDIQKDSGFVNNASCLALLEKVWTAVPAVGNSLVGSPNQEQATPTLQPGVLHGGVNGFRFRDVMLAEANEGEWIVV